MFLILLPKQLVPDKYSSFMMIFFIFVIRVKIYVLNCRLASLFVLLVASKVWISKRKKNRQNFFQK